MTYQKLSFFLNQKLWYQLSRLIQELLILIKNSKLLKIGNQGDIWFLFGNSLYKFFRKFYSYVKKNTLQLTHFLLICGIAKYEIFYVEDRISFIERELFKFKENPKSLSGEILIFSILIFSKTSLSWTKDNHKWLNQVYLMKKIKKKDFLLETIFRISEILSTYKIPLLQCTSIPFLFSTSTKLQKRKSILRTEENLFEKLRTGKKEKEFNQNIFPGLFRLMEKMIINTFFESEWEKKIWISDTHLSRTNNNTKTHNCFFQKPFENFIWSFFFDWTVKRKVFENINFVLNRRGDKKNLRWSKFGKFLEFSPAQIEISLLNFKRNLDLKLFLDQERQLLKRKEEIFFDGNSFERNFVRKNFLFIKKSKKLSELSQIIKKKKKEIPDPSHLINL